MKPKSEFFCDYNLTKTRKKSKNKYSVKEPAEHQSKALNDIFKWYRSKNNSEAGGLVVLPTGGGKTFTAIRFLCAGPLSDGYKVLWLAHTHHLLEQAFIGFHDSVSKITEPKNSLTVRIVSGTPGHFPVNSIKSSDDIIIGTLQTIRGADVKKHPKFKSFINSSKGKLFVIFDEAHHSPAPSYRKLMMNLREKCNKMFLLGLTATPTYEDERKKGWLNKIFPQNIIHQVSPQKLMAANILSKPIFEEPLTNFDPEFDEHEYEKWLGTNHDLPEEIVTQLAKNSERNAFIAETYAKNKKKYGKTIIFADRWFQCEFIAENLMKHGIKAGAVYSHIDAKLGSANERNKRNKDENAIILEQFRSGKIDVLLNVRMLTEGTDVPDIKSVFLTRQTTSNTLMAQMIGRGLRGVRFGGTSEAYIVSFIDNWKVAINWAGFDKLDGGGLMEDATVYGKRPPLQLISIELIRRLARQAEIGILTSSVPFRSLLPIGWYKIEYITVLKGTDEIENRQQLIIVFENELENYQNFINHILKENIQSFEEEELFYEDVSESILKWEKKFFSNSSERFGFTLSRDIFRIVRHIAQNGEAPKFFHFEERDNHNLDSLALEILDKKLDRMSEDQLLFNEYNRVERFWKTLYYTYDLFKTQFDSCMNRIIEAKKRGENSEEYIPVFTNPEVVPDREPSEELKRQIIETDKSCLCCGSELKLEVDHISPFYYNANSMSNNLQTLCKDCNIQKGTQVINFRLTQTQLKSPLKSFPQLKPPEKNKTPCGRIKSETAQFEYVCPDNL